MFETKGWGTDELVDLDGDGRPELVRVRLSLSVLEIVEALVTRSLDARIEIYQAGLESGFADKPAMKRKLDLALDFASGRARGFVPNVRADLNGDGYRDLLSSGSGKRVEVFLGGARDPYKHRAARQSFSTNGRIRFGRPGRGRDGRLRPLRSEGPGRIAAPGPQPGRAARLRSADLRASADLHPVGRKQQDVTSEARPVPGHDLGQAHGEEHAAQPAGKLAAEQLADLLAHRTRARKENPFRVDVCRDVRLSLGTPHGCP